MAKAFKVNGLPLKKTIREVVEPHLHGNSYGVYGDSSFKRDGTFDYRVKFSGEYLVDRAIQETLEAELTDKLGCEVCVRRGYFGRGDCTVHTTAEAGTWS